MLIIKDYIKYFMALNHLKNCGNLNYIKISIIIKNYSPNRMKHF